VRKQLTGEPVAGELHSGFGGRGWLAPFPTPMCAREGVLLAGWKSLPESATAP
jgi:hypothetical protein